MLVHSALMVSRTSPCAIFRIGRFQQARQRVPGIDQSRDLFGCRARTSDLFENFGHFPHAGRYCRVAPRKPILQALHAPDNPLDDIEYFRRRQFVCRSDLGKLMGCLREFLRRLLNRRLQFRHHRCDLPDEIQQIPEQSPGVRFLVEQTKGFIGPGKHHL